jgi:hypothetical protein
MCPSFLFAWLSNRFFCRMPCCAVLCCAASCCVFVCCAVQIEEDWNAPDIDGAGVSAVPESDRRGHLNNHGQRDLQCSSPQPHIFITYHYVGGPHTTICQWPPTRGREMSGCCRAFMGVYICVVAPCTVLLSCMLGMYGAADWLIRSHMHGTVCFPGCTDPAPPTPAACAAVPPTFS